MLINELTERIEKCYPLMSAESWDNVGLLLGDASSPVRKVLLSLDLSDEAVHRAVESGADLVITHHPLIFSPLKKITADDIIGRRLLLLARYGISYYAMHTNFDIGGMGFLNADELGLVDTEVLSVTDEQERPAGFGRVGSLPYSMTAGELAQKAKALYALPSIRLYGDPDRTVKRVGICSGSGKSFIREVIDKGADVYITGDLDYHTAIDALAMGLMLIDGGHYGTEYGFMDYMKKQISGWFPELLLETLPVKQPYHII